jgi:ABC-type uncharacterized transport system substrate-binding protein
MSCIGPLVESRGFIAWRLICAQFTLPLLLVFFLTSSCISASVPAPSPARPVPKNVLVLSSFSERSGFIELEPLKAGVRSHLTSPVNFSVEYLDSVRFEDPEYRKSLSETLHHAYKDTKLDLVIVQAYPALRLLLDYRDQMFPGVPILIGVVSDRLHGEKIPPGMTGVTTLVDIRGSLNLALRLHPDTQNVVLISGVSQFERYWDEAFRQEFRLHYGNLNLIEVAGPPDSRVLDQVFAGQIRRNGAGNHRSRIGV